MNNILTETFKIILGDKPIPYYLAGFIFAFLAVLLSLYLHSKRRDKASVSTPEKFSWRFLLWDNTKRLVSSLIVSFIFFRLFDLSNPFAMIGFGFFIAFGVDKAIELLMEKTNIMNFLKTNRENFKE